MTSGCCSLQNSFAALGQTWNFLLVNLPSLTLPLSGSFRSSLSQQPAPGAELQPAGHRHQALEPPCRRGCCRLAWAGERPSHIPQGSWLGGEVLGAWMGPLDQKRGGLGTQRALE